MSKNDWSNQTKHFIRHPATIPLEYSVTDIPAKYNLDYMNNVSQGGLSFHSSQYIEPSQWLRLSIPINEEHFEADAQVRWCQATAKNNSYDVGVSFSDYQEAFSARMVEQICYIKEYKEYIRQKEGRELSSDQAAAEWISKYANEFPKADI